MLKKKIDLYNIINVNAFTFIVSFNIARLLFLFSWIEIEINATQQISQYERKLLGVIYYYYYTFYFNLLILSVYL